MTEVIDKSTEFPEQHGTPGRHRSRRRLAVVTFCGRARSASPPSALGAGKVLMQPSLQGQGFLSPDGVFGAASQAVADSLYIEAFPVSPLILNPFTDPLLILQAAKPLSPAEVAALNPPPGPGVGQQNSFGNETHQIWTDAIGFPDPIVYDDQGAGRAALVHHVAGAADQRVWASRRSRSTRTATPSRPAPSGTCRRSTIYGFNGTFPGPMINTEYGKPVLVRFSNHLDENPLNLDRQDFGDPELRFLTHLHNAHTAPESDGNPHYAFLFGPKDHGFPVEVVRGPAVPELAGRQRQPGEAELLLVPRPRDGLHRRRMSTRAWSGSTRSTTRRTTWTPATRPRACGCPASAPTTPTGRSTSSTTSRWRSTTSGWTTGSRSTRTSTTAMGEFPAAGNPRDAPGVVGQVVLQALPQPRLRRRHLHRQRHRVPDAGGQAAQVPVPVPGLLDLPDLRAPADDLDERAEGGAATSATPPRTELQGQYRIEDGQQAMNWTQIASDGGLLPFPLTRATFELWPAKRREHIVDFTKYKDGSPTKKGDVLYLTNVMKMTTGRMWDNSTRFSPDPNYKIPIMKIVIGDDAPDNSVLPGPTTKLRDLPPLPSNWQTLLDDRLIFEVQRGSRRRRARVADQRQAVRPHDRTAQPEEQGRPPVPGDAEEELLQPLGDPQRRRRLGAPHPPAHGRTPHRHAEQQGHLRRARPRPPRRHLPRGPRRARPLRSHDPLPRIP